MPGTAVLSEVSPRDGCFAPLLHPKHTHTRPGNLRRAQITASRSPAPARAPQHRHDRLKRTGSDQAPARTDLLIGESSDLPPKSGRQETQRCNADQRYLCQGEREVNLWIEEQSQTIFAFEWESPTMRRKEQLCWTVLPQGFKNSPTLFGEILAKELAQWQEGNKNVTLLQHVDDILIGADSEQICLEVTVSLLNFLGLAGYRVSKKKAQIAKKEVQYLGFKISKGQRALGAERKEAICRIAVPRTKRHLRGFLGMAGFCRIWIPNFGLITKPLLQP
ncbi:coiled-coil domain-containing protein 166 isoform X2 [Rhea pennata]|uniref:coiled-coil domain-containing protein 166 isoform X2 n=1 Tax=Rhea pennata TaxID=8795 RepID=UPI002E252390